METVATRSSLRARTIWFLITLFAGLIASYAFAYVVVGERMYPRELAESFRARPWGINPHALFGGIGLITGAMQFHRGLRRRLRVHRVLGRIYVVACIGTGGAGVYMAAYSYGGWVTHTAFAALGVLLIATTVAGYRAVLLGDVEAHRRWMTRSYALIFAGVTLRIELPLLIAYFGAFAPAYAVVAWLCWVPNLLLAEFVVRRRELGAYERRIVPV